MFDVPASEKQVTTFASLLKPVQVETAQLKVKRTAAELEELRNEAKREGHAEGYALGVAEGKADGFLAGKEEGYRAAHDEAARAHQEELATFHQAFLDLIARVEGSMTDWYRKSEPSLAQLSTLIASRVLARELKISPDSIVAMAREAITEVTHAVSARIRVNPFDVALLQEHKEELMAASGSLRELQIVEDPAILGGCVIESDGGVIESVLDAKLHLILDNLRSAA